MKKITICLITLVLCGNAFGIKKSAKKVKLTPTLIARTESMHEIETDLIENMLDHWLVKSSFWVRMFDWVDKIKKKKRVKPPKVVKKNVLNWIEELLDYWLDQSEKNKYKKTRREKKKTNCK